MLVYVCTCDSLQLPESECVMSVALCSEEVAARPLLSLVSSVIDRGFCFPGMSAGTHASQLFCRGASC